MKITTINMTPETARFFGFVEGVTYYDEDNGKPFQIRLTSPPRGVSLTSKPKEGLPASADA